MSLETKIDTLKLIMLKNLIQFYFSITGIGIPAEVDIKREKQHNVISRSRERSEAPRQVGRYRQRPLL